MMDDEDRTRCPTCGQEIEDVKRDEGNLCPRGHGPFQWDELIGPEDDYAWCL